MVNRQRHANRTIGKMMYDNVTPVIRPALGGTVPLSGFLSRCPQQDKICIQSSVGCMPLCHKNMVTLYGRHKSFQIQVHLRQLRQCFFCYKKKTSWMGKLSNHTVPIQYSTEILKKWKNKFVVCFVASHSEAGNPFHGLRHSLIETSRRPVTAASIALTGRITEWA